MDEKQLRREIALAITNLRGVKLVFFICEYSHKGLHTVWVVNFEGSNIRGL